MSAGHRGQEMMLRSFLDESINEHKLITREVKGGLSSGVRALARDDQQPNIMKTKKTSSWRKGLAFCILFGLVPPAGAGQKGLGDRTGIARSGTRPEVVSLAGQLVEFDTHRCEKTTGPAPLGTHLTLKTADGRKINLHLGPSTAVEGLVRGMKEGIPLRVRAFRTGDMENTAYVAVSLRGRGRTVVLRDPKTLRPVWAGKQGRRGNGSRGRR